MDLGIACFFQHGLCLVSALVLPFPLGALVAGGDYGCFQRQFFLGDGEGVSCLQPAPVEHPAENALAGHDAVAHLPKNLAMAVALLANLGDFKEDLAGLQSGAYRQLVESYALSHDVFAEVPKLHLAAPAAEVLDFLQGQEAHLPVPVPGVGISLEAVFRDEKSFFYRAFAGALLFAHADCLDFSCAHISLLPDTYSGCPALPVR